MDFVPSMGNWPPCADETGPRRYTMEYKIDRNGNFTDLRGYYHDSQIYEMSKMSTRSYMFISHVTADYDDARQWAKKMVANDPGIDTYYFDMEQEEPDNWNMLIHRIKLGIREAKKVGLYYSENTTKSNSWWVPMEAGIAETYEKDRTVGVATRNRRPHVSLSGWKREIV